MMTEKSLCDLWTLDQNKQVFLLLHTLSGLIDVPQGIGTIGQLWI